VQISSKGLGLIKEFEGLRLDVYTDPAGHPTIGYGHLILEGEDFCAGISQDQADCLLAADVRKSEAAVLSGVRVSLTQNQYDALVSFVFNVGSSAFAKSTMLAKINSADYSGASAEFVRWVHGGGRVLPGLVRRRESERRLFDN